MDVKEKIIRELEKWGREASEIIIVFLAWGIMISFFIGISIVIFGAVEPFLPRISAWWNNESITGKWKCDSDSAIGGGKVIEYYIFKDNGEYVKWKEGDTKVQQSGILDNVDISMGYEVSYGDKITVSVNDEYSGIKANIGEKPFIAKAEYILQFIDKNIMHMSIKSYNVDGVIRDTTEFNQLCVRQL